MLTICYGLLFSINFYENNEIDVFLVDTVVSKIVEIDVFFNKMELFGNNYLNVDILVIFF